MALLEQPRSQTHQHLFEPRQRGAAPAAQGEPTMTGLTFTGAAAEPETPVDVKQTALQAAGGPWGIVASTIPSLVFAGVVGFVSLPLSIGIAIAVAVVIAGVQLRRGETFSAASGGLVGVAVSGGISAATGSANDFFLIGIWASLAIGIVPLASILMRRPLTGAIWNAMHGGNHAWRADRPAARAHYLATGAVAVMGLGRFAVQQWLYLADATGALAIADTVMGFPLTGLVAVVVIWAFRRSTKRMVTSGA